MKGIHLKSLVRIIQDNILASVYHIESHNRWEWLLLSLQIDCLCSLLLQGHHPPKASNRGQGNIVR